MNRKTNIEVLAGRTDLYGTYRVARWAGIRPALLRSMLLDWIEN